jgi:ABC-type transport system involved in cytochrome c biogenesis ATPase subunit
MKITKFQFEDKSLEWRLEELQLNKLTLLVGASGVGKTQILRALMNLKEIANGKSFNGVAWHIEFETLDNKKYVWEGEFENKNGFIETDDNDKKNKSKIVFEKLYLNTILITDRNSEKIIFNNKPTIKLSQQESILSLLKEEDLVNPAHNGLQKLHFIDYAKGFGNINTITFMSKDFFNIDILLKKNNTLNKIQESDLKISEKLLILSKIDNRVFTLLKQRFISIFPNVEDIEVRLDEPKSDNTSVILKDYQVLSIQIKEKNVKNWITQFRISSGMFRTLIQLSELYLCTEGTVFLIDEFENSLGINCINEITNDILASRRQLQFILTSHHPYIIDAISFNNWKLVTRNGGVIKTHNIDKFNIGKSKHSAFMQLLQLEEYQTGQEKEQEKV